MSEYRASVLITGGTSGLGFECARAIASKNTGAQVVITGRNEEKVQSAAKRIRTASKNPHVVGSILDLSSFDSIRQFATTWGGLRLPPLNALVCNAGVQVVQGTRYTREGFELTFGVNHLGHFLLTRLLLPKMTHRGRIVVVSSGTHDPHDPLARKMGIPAPHYRDPDALARPDRHPDPAEDGRDAAWVGLRRYATSKLCNLLFAFELHRRLQAAGRPLLVNGFDPGLMPGSGLARDYPELQRFAWNFVLPSMRLFVRNVNSTKSSGRALARLVLDDTFAEVSGRYFEGLRETSSSPDSRDESKQAQLWSASLRLTGSSEATNVESGRQRLVALVNSSSQKGI